MNYYDRYRNGFVIVENKYNRQGVTVKWVRFYSGVYYYAVAIYDNKDKLIKERDYKTYKGARDYYNKITSELLTRA